MTDICVLTNEEIGDAIGATDSVPTSAVLAARAVSLWIDANYGPMVERTITAETHNGGDLYIQLNRFPVVSVTTLTEDIAGTVTTLTNITDFLLIPEEGVVYRRTDYWPRLFPLGQRNIACTYVVGRYTTQAAVPEDVKAAAQIATAHVHASQHGAGSDTYGAPLSGFMMPNAAKEFLDVAYGPARGVYAV